MSEVGWWRFKPAEINAFDFLKDILEVHVRRANRGEHRVVNWPTSI